MQQRPIFYRPYVKYFDAQSESPTYKSALGPGLYDIAKKRVPKCNCASFSQAPQRPQPTFYGGRFYFIERKVAAPAPALYKADKAVKTRSMTPGPSYFRAYSSRSCILYASDRFPQKPNYEKQAELIVSRQKARQTPSRQTTSNWVAKGYAFSGDRYKDDISWLKYSDFTF